MPQRRCATPTRASAGARVQPRSAWPTSTWCRCSTIPTPPWSRCRRGPSVSGAGRGGGAGPPPPSEELAVGAHEEDLQGVEGLEALARTQDDALEGRVDQVHGEHRLLGDAPVEAAQHAAATDEVDALDDEVLG